MSNGDVEDTLKRICEPLTLLTRDKQKQAADDRVVAMNNVLKLVGTFNYEPQNDTTFTRWFTRNEPYLKSHCTSDKERGQIVLKAFEVKEYNQLRGRASPDDPEDKSHEELISTLEAMFAESRSLFRRRHDTLVYKHAPGKLSEDVVNATKLAGNDFDFKKLTMENFDIIIMLLQLSDPSYKNPRAVIMRAVDEKPDITLEDLGTTMRRYQNRTEDAQIDSSPQGATQEATVFTEQCSAVAL